MSFVQHLEHKRDALQQQYDLLAEKLKELRRNYAIKASTSVRFQLEKQIEQTEAELDELAYQIDALGSERLYRALLKLGYRKQAKNFRKFTEVQSVAAFLIHACSQDYGQRWLLNRLVINHVPKSINAKSSEIANLIPMFEVSRRGLQDAVGVLRGHHTNFQGQRK